MNKTVWLQFLISLVPTYALLGGFLRGVQKDGDNGLVEMINEILGTTSDGCPNNFVKMPKSQCTCLYLALNISTQLVTYLAAQDYCMNVVDMRSHVATFSTINELIHFENLLYPYKNFIGASNVPIGLYKSSGGEIRQLQNQNITSMLSQTFNGKCSFFFPDNSNTNGCLQLAKSIACEMPCDNDLSAIPHPTVTQGSRRCDVASYNSSIGLLQSHQAFDVFSIGCLCVTVCPPNWFSIGGVCYMNPIGSNILMTYSEASMVCQNVGGHLPSFSDIYEWLALTNYVFTNGISGTDSWAAPMWLGGMLNDSLPTWDDETPWTFSYWAPNEPNKENSCIWWSVGQGRFWSTGDCSIPGVVFCQQYKCPGTHETKGGTTATQLVQYLETSATITMQSISISSVSEISTFASTLSADITSISSSITTSTPRISAFNTTLTSTTSKSTTNSVTSLSTIKSSVIAITELLPPTSMLATSTNSGNTTMLTVPNTLVMSNVTDFNDSVVFPQLPDFPFEGTKTKVSIEPGPTINNTSNPEFNETTLIPEFFSTVPNSAMFNDTISINVTYLVEIDDGPLVATNFFKNASDATAFSDTTMLANIANNSIDLDLNYTIISSPDTVDNVSNSIIINGTGLISGNIDNNLSHTMVFNKTIIMIETMENISDTDGIDDTIISPEDQINNTSNAMARNDTIFIHANIFNNLTNPIVFNNTINNSENILSTSRAVDFNDTITGSADNMTSISNTMAINDTV